MNKKQLEQRVKQENISEYYHSLEGGFPNEAFAVNMSNNAWEVYYSERGNKSQLKIFKSEENTCDYFYNWIMKILKKHKQRTYCILVTNLTT